MGFVKRIFGGGGGNANPQPMVQQPITPTQQQTTTSTPQQTAVAAPVATDSTLGNMQTGNGDTTIRKRRGKSALIIPNVNSNTGSSTGGGLNV